MAESFVSADKMYCMYLAANEALIHRHAELMASATRVTEIGGGSTLRPLTSDRQPAAGSGRSEQTSRHNCSRELSAFGVRL